MPSVSRYLICGVPPTNPAEQRRKMRLLAASLSCDADLQDSDIIIAGVLVYRNNQKKVEAALSVAEAAVSQAKTDVQAIKDKAQGMANALKK